VSTAQTTAATTFDELMRALKELESDDQLPLELSRQRKSHNLGWRKLKMFVYSFSEELVI
jgi:hypothetical protein